MKYHPHRLVAYGAAGTNPFHFASIALPMRILLFMAIDHDSIKDKRDHRRQAEWRR
ncbi:hypothetical protein [Burkholderia gladioli]|uniref:hypothetical protein n=1 Tax=Burkholderia gladioli TaxID=28095 RepID=UPI00163F8CA0|nr:hypothetical protein [Burkholderia gladioli]